ncbi:putative ring finger membrane protein [Eutypa lata UCREL1]|uniref:RING-type E3 ubiquitin transferase n=1 Tax=Eutypa lata (strain UCR-EL1) TaxID=1287681 RepID=M7SN82_EUTLA|nr:putative ring finger membrane protein [Eutypa lata UCREL1]
MAEQRTSWHVGSSDHSNEHHDGTGAGDDNDAAPNANANANTTTTAASASAAAAAAAADPDTCRICRGEGTTEEPLFYPCKCSGSIKFVHQDCLMEWLSHSQKKHCELCKTPFRFTKLYSPDMPQRLPFYIFMSHMAKYLFRKLLVWLRAALVISVWLGWLPYLMRSVWSFLFWLSEESFGPTTSSPFGGSTNYNNTASLRAGDVVTLTITGASTSTCPSSPLLAATTTAASIGGVMKQIPVNDLFKAISKPLNISATQSWLASLLRLSVGSLGLPDGSTQEALDNLNLTQVDKVTVSAVPNPHGSLLSEIPALKTLTRHPTINRTIIAVLEGQIITVVVIVAFILIILVRDYVVQQQPEINMRAAFAADVDRHNVEAPAGPEHPDLRGPDSDSDDEMVDDEEEEEDRDEGIDSSDEDTRPAQERDESDIDVRARRLATMGFQDFQQRQRPIAGFRRRATRPNAQDRRLDEPPPYHSEGATQTDPTHPSNSRQPDQYDMPDQLDDSDYARALAGAIKDDAPSDGTSTVTQYLRIYREAEGDPDKILQTIRDQGLEDRLRHWVRITQSMPAHAKQSTHADNRPRNESDSTAAADNWHPTSSQADQPAHITDTMAEENSQSSTSSWTWPEGEDNQDEGAATAAAKGKQKAESSPARTSNEAPRQEDVPWSRWEQQFENTPWQRSNAQEDDLLDDDLVAPLGRPRAVSDGPQRNEAINPLANNSWSFSKLPSSSTNQPVESAQPGQTTQDSSARQPFSDPFSFHSPVETRQQIPELAHPFPHNGVGDDASSPDSPKVEQVDDAGLGAIPETSSNAGQGESDEEINLPLLGNLDNIENASTEVQIGEPLEADQAGLPARQHAGGIVDRVAEFMWGDVHVDQPGELEPDDEGVDIFGDNQDAPFMDVGAVEDNLANNDDVAPEVVEAAMAAGLDPEAIEDAEDFEGIMELIGMRGPLAGLFQNAIFCAFLVSFSIFLGIFIPYNIGRVSVWVIANPTRFIRIIFSCFKLAQDVVLLALGCASTFFLDFFQVVGRTIRVDLGRQLIASARSMMSHIAIGAFNRISDIFVSEMPLISASEMRNFSAISHEALVFVKGDINYLFSTFAAVLRYILGGDYISKWTTAKELVIAVWPDTWEILKSIPHALAHPGSWMVSVNLSPESSSVVNPALAYWNATDRALAVLGGYVSLFVAAALYLGRGRPFSTTQTAQEWEASAIDALNQASGVMKVILIISIEMLVFPLYCGLLLDFALLPLFESTTFKSRLFFTYNFPMTSIFVHWFVGTGYMFHFALFVSMCRKIMRKGVLYFIRDPDDPEFHPVRDVLERNVTTQLRKIMFSGLIYGALVVVCLGGVVWGLALALPNVLPIHYSSNEPVLEFPIDLLFYNFLMPLAVKFFRPSDGLHAMYTWWFRTCARGLRLTWFLFGERRVDEEGRIVLAPDSEHKDLPWWRKLFLEVDESGNVIPKTWRDTFEGGHARPTPHIPRDEMVSLTFKKMRLVDSGQLIEDGRFVRSPASDQVKIPKGQPVFLAVTEQNVRPDGSDDGDIYASDKYQCVYVPPMFHIRVSLFIASIWLFAAVTGVGFTIVPLVFAWTLGILYLKLGTRALVHCGGRPAQAVRAVLREGWAYPDVGVLTRAFVLPGLAAGLVFILTPPLMARAALDYGLLTATFSTGIVPAAEQLQTREARVFVFRMAYPFAALFLVAFLFTRRVMRVFDGWKIRIRDEAYLIGERLHNFGGAVKGAAGWRGSRRIA